ncbi:uncharacterized protein DSM5745_10182 [Aspergillus mulundensis]|uniref:Uncharacterized protein n=1 Tax=Aspergillus mulundensis TaxID=1810919 RepID=A0A3D8QMY9_9EURO|nr:hypothetical protein DSM5745_10182 [Aspergillus mulundensis]RDW63071.1 hypothetical protein DSM5745_10182 [Aspergillus mulundensis]
MNPPARALSYIASLSSKQVRQYIRKYGVQAVLAAQQAYAQWRDGRASKQKEQTYKSIEAAIPEIIESVESKEIRVVPEAFNSSAPFIAKFQGAALVSIALALLDLSAAVKRVGSSLEAIQNELAVANVARIQGWVTDGFGAHVYRFVRNEMAQARNNQAQAGDNSGEESQGGQQDCFYVWHPDTDWYPVFENMNAANPLGPQFGGYHRDLPTICMRMRTDRETLVQQGRGPHGRTATFHLLIPAYKPLVVDYPITFHEGLLPLTITGQRHREADLVWLDIWRAGELEGLNLRCVGNLPPRDNIYEQTARVSIVAGKLGFIVCAGAAAVFPPCAPIAMPAAASCGTGSSFASLGAMIVSILCARKEICILGNPIMFTDEA